MQNQQILEQQQPEATARFYRYYLAMPPAIAPIVASMLMQDVEFKPFELYENHSEYCQNIANATAILNKMPLRQGSTIISTCSGIGFNDAWWDEVMAKPMVGFLISSLTALTLYYAYRYLLRTQHSYNSPGAADGIIGAIKAIAGKIETMVPKANTPFDAITFLVLCGITSACYEMIGAEFLGRAHTIYDDTNTALSQAIGSTLPASIGVGLLWGYKSAKYCIEKVKNEDNCINKKTLKPTPI